MRELLDTRKLDRASRAAIAVALDRLRGRSPTGQVYVRIGGRNACVNALWPPSSEEEPGWSAAAARRAATAGRRLLPVLGSGELDGWLWIAYDMGSASSLPGHPRRLLLPTATSMRLLLDVARALDGAALAGFFPHELPPASVFVSREGARLGDLGTAREALRRSDSRSVGDTAYVPPEVLRGEPAGQRSGVYLFAALLYRLLSGASPRHGQPVPLASWRPDLPARLDSIVAAAMSDEPRRRPRSALEVHEVAKLALEGETRLGSAGAAAGAAAPGPARTPDPREPAPPAPARTPDPLEPAARATPPFEPALPATPPFEPAPPTNPRRPLRAAAIACSVVLGAAIGLLLGASPDPRSAPAELVSERNLAVTLPPGWRAAGAPRGEGLTLRAGGGSSLEARVVDEPVVRRAGSQPVRLGALQAWRTSEGHAVRYAAPTTAGTVLITCRASPAGGDRLRMCERVASTLRLRGARALPLASAIEEEDRLRAAVAALRTERNAGRRRLARARRRSGQRAVARELAASHRRAALALDPVADAEPIEAAARSAAAAYSSLAASATGPSNRPWNAARERVRRRDAALAEALAAWG